MKENINVRRGDVIRVNLSGMRTEAKSHRYFVVISNDLGNKYSDRITVVPLSTTYYKKRTGGKGKVFPTWAHVKFNGQDTFCLAERVITLPKERVTEWAGRVEMAEIDLRIKWALGLEFIPTR